MTKQQLEEIFDQMDKGEYNPSSQEVIMLVEEIERLMNERDTAFARGVAAMREAVVKSVTCHFPTINAGGNCGLCTFCDAALDKHILALPIPEYNNGK